MVIYNALIVYEEKSLLLGLLYTLNLFSPFQNYFNNNADNGPALRKT